MSSAIVQSFILNDPIQAREREAIALAAKNLNETELRAIFKPETDIAYLESITAQIRSDCKHLVIVGTGASSNIPRILFSFMCRSELQIHFLEDADSSKAENLMSRLDPDTTKFLVISKSGQTVEILALLSLCLKWAEERLHLAELSKIFYFITSNNKDNYILEIATKLGATILEHPTLSGRYSFFSSVGLLPAAIAGFDINLILKHAESCINGLFKEASWLLEGATYLTYMSKQYHNSVLMTYSSHFNGLGLYFRQLISESLGKAGQGINPVLFEGNIDQHSQLQSYLDGLPDKFFTILIPAIDKHNSPIASKLFDLDYLKGKTLSDINHLQINSVIELLKRAGKNIRLLKVMDFNEKFIAEIVTCFMLETILYAKLNNIDPFTQTAIETMKHAVREAVTL